jgi:hypothetical protein
MCTHTHTHTHTHTYIHTYTSMHRQTHTHTHAHIHRVHDDSGSGVLMTFRVPAESDLSWSEAFYIQHFTIDDLRILHSTFHN